MELKCLESLLQKSLKKNELRVVDFSSTSLLPPGENFASIMIKLDVKIQKDRRAKEEILHLVAKTPSTERPVVEWSSVFKKELFMYVELAPLYKQLERDAGIEDSQLINIWPAYIGHRNSLSNGNTIDNDSMLLLDNITYKDFYILNKRVGLDMHHARKTITLLARYHALGIVMQKQRPEFAEEARKQARILGIDFPVIDKIYDQIFKIFEETPSLQKHRSIIERSFCGNKDGQTYKAEPTKPWATITHGDFWTNNILFHKDSEGNVDEVKFVDFQMYLYTSPVKDLPYFLTSSIEKAEKINNLDDLITLYYDHFIQTLKRMNCDISPFTRESFNKELKKNAINEFPLCCLSIKFVEFQPKDKNMSKGDQLHNAMGAENNDAYIDKLKWLVEFYEKQGWF